MHDDLSYFARRAAQERAAAASAGDERARAAHERLAAHYRALIRSAGTGEIAAEATADAAS